MKTLLALFFCGVAALSPASSVAQQPPAGLGRAPRLKKSSRSCHPDRSSGGSRTSPPSPKPKPQRDRPD
jgi:hypothetical protein